MPATRLKQVLFLDDDPEFLESLQSLFPSWVRSEWIVSATHDVAHALVLMRESPIDLVVADLNMPFVDGLQFLRLLHQVCPEPRKVVLTSIADEDYREQCLQCGASLYMVKPSSVSAFETIFRLLNELMEWSRDPGFSGVLKRVALADLIQLECMTRSSTVLHVHTSAVEGSIFIRDGRVIHAMTERACGLEAFFILVNLRTGNFVLRPFTEPTLVTIHASCDGLLLAAAQRWDEGDQPMEAVASSPVMTSTEPETAEHELDSDEILNPPGITESSVRWPSTAVASG